MKLYIFPFILLFIAGCNSTTTTQTSSSEDENLTSVENNITQDEVNSTVLDILNSIRKSSGLNSLKTNLILDKSALNHSKYLVLNNEITHYEDENKTGFCGITPANRAINVGYKSKKVLENLSSGQDSEELSIDGLMGAIYHRFGFLAFDIDELGYARDDKLYVYNMGNSKLNALCSGSSFEGVGEYYVNVCADESFKIDAKSYKEALNLNSGVEYVIYPYKDQTNVTPVFYEETPDPLVDYSVSSIPISIEFNANELNISKLSIDEFNIKDEDGNELELIAFNDGSTILNKENDINLKFTQTEFAIFPKDRLDYNKTYNVYLKYIYNEEPYELRWSFKTKSLSNLIVYSEDTLNLKLDKDYNIYFKPVDRLDVIHNYNVNCSYISGGSVDIDSKMVDKNTINLKVSGAGVESCKILLNDTKEIKIDF